MPFIPGMNRSRASVITQNSRANGEAGEYSSSPCKLPLPPSSTPTRTLLRRIQRRSSTSAETVTRQDQHDRSALPLLPPKLTPATLGSAAARRAPQSSTPVQRKSLNVARSTTLQRRASNASLSSFAMASRHARTPSNATVRTTATQKTVKPLQNKMDIKSSVSDGPTANMATEVKMPHTPIVSSHGEKVKTLVLASLTMPAISPVTPSSAEGKHVVAPPKKRFSMVERTALLKDAGTQQGQGLTHEAAAALEQEFAEQERILQGLQRDNERKTIEVEELRRQKARFEDFCSRHFGADDWYEMVFGMRQARSPTEKHERTLISSPYTTKAGDDDRDVSIVSTSSQVIVENLLKTLQTPGPRPATLSVEQGQAILDDTPASSPLRGSIDSSKLMSDSFESALADQHHDQMSKKAEDMVTVPRRLIQSLCDTQQSLLDALSAHI